MVLSPLESTKITTTPDGRPEFINPRCSTPYLSRSLTSAKPTGSFPTLATIAALLLVRVIQVATLAACPPGWVEIRAAVSFP